MVKKQNILIFALLSLLSTTNLMAMNFLIAAKEILFDQEEENFYEEEIPNDSLTQSQIELTEDSSEIESKDNSEEDPLAMTQAQENDPNSHLLEKYEEIPLNQPLDDTQNQIANSVMLGCYDGFAQALKSAQAQALKDKSKPLIAHIIELNNPLMLNGLIIDGFKKKAFTPFDLKWAIEHFSLLSENEKKAANIPFLLMMDTNSPGKRAEALLDLITKVTIEKSVTVDRNGLFNTGVSLFAYYASPFVKSHSTNEYWNVLVETLEKGYIDALNIILDRFPNLVGQLDTTISVKRKEYVADKDEEVAYSFIEWLMRNKNGTKNAYISRNALASQKNFYYPEIAKMIAKRMVVDEKTSISDASFEMVSLLRHQEDLSDEEFKSALQKIKKS